MQKLEELFQNKLLANLANKLAQAELQGAALSARVDILLGQLAEAQKELADVKGQLAEEMKLTEELAELGENGEGDGGSERSE